MKIEETAYVANKKANTKAVDLSTIILKIILSTIGDLKITITLINLNHYSY